MTSLAQRGLCLGGVPNHPDPLFGDLDLHLFNEGQHTALWHHLGGRLIDGPTGAHFSVWAPNAQSVHVVGDFTKWDSEPTALERLGSSGVWVGFHADAAEGDRYKYRLVGARGTTADKADPMGFKAEQQNGNASILARLDHEWEDDEWLAARGDRNRWDQPISVYEVHLGSWRRDADTGRLRSYAEQTQDLVAHVKAMGFTHVELLPITEHPLYASWGYQTIGYFAATSRYGSPTELQALIDAFHQAEIGVLLDWVPSHFPTDGFGLALFDETHLYEHADPREGFHPDWKSAIFNYGRHEVRSFLLSSARFWLEEFHFDGLRVDAVASMLYRDYSRGSDWIPNKYGGRENLEAVEFLKQLNAEMYATFPDTLMIAEESTAWPGVTRETDHEGLGFGFKWDMGWMNDSLEYFQFDPVYRSHHHHKLTFRSLYGSSENFVLPLSHDEVVHGKGSLLEKMPGTDDERHANLRLLFGWQFATPGKKLLFMGSELAPWLEWNHDDELPWYLTSDVRHEGILQWVRALNELYTSEPALHRLDNDPMGFRWVDADNDTESMFSLIRTDGEEEILVVMNATPVARDFPIGSTGTENWQPLLSSADSRFWFPGASDEHTAIEVTDGQMSIPGLCIAFLKRNE